MQKDRLCDRQTVFFIRIEHSEKQFMSVGLAHSPAKVRRLFGTEVHRRIDAARHSATR